MKKQLSCKDCEHLKANLPLKEGKFIFQKAKAYCTHEHGLLTNFMGGKQYNPYNVSDHIDWKIYGQLCRHHTN